jgi:hypothetical protein
MGKYYHKGAPLREPEVLPLLEHSVAIAKNPKNIWDDEAIPKHKIAAVNAMYQ